MKNCIASVALFAVCTAWCADVTISPGGDVPSLAAAIEKVRALRAAGTIPAGRAAEVEILPGRYRMTEPVTFGPADGGIHFMGATGGEAVFDGSVELPPFTARADGIWEARVPAGLSFDQLWVNGQRATRARTPNEFYLYMKAPYEEDENPLTGKIENMAHRAFYAHPADLAPLKGLSQEELSRVYMIAWQSWCTGYMPLAHVNTETGLVVLGGSLSRPCFFWSSTCPRYVLENYRGALDAPGEWFLDEKAGKLLYIPRAGEAVASARAVAPVAPSFVVLAGTPEARVKDVAFRRVAFEYAAYNLPPTGMREAQSAINVSNAAIHATSAEGFVFARGRVAHVGAHGFWLRDDCHDCTIEDSLVEDLGCGGVYFGDTRVAAPERATSGLKVVNSIIRHGGRLFHGAIGVWLGNVHDCTVEHNDIGDFRYTGISMGWTWGYRPTVVRRNRIAFNRIHHIGWGMLSDMGGFYSLGDCTGSEVVGNWVHDVNGYSGSGSPAWGLYTDEGSHGIVFASNLVERCRDGAVHQHYGKENVFRNNILATFDRNGVWRSRVESHTTIIVTNNVFWWTNPEAHLLSGDRGRSVKDVVFDGNLYWGVNGVATNAFSGRGLEAWRAEGHDLSSKFEDPLFVDSAHGDWRLKPESPALKMGFVPWDWTEAGVRKENAAWRAFAENVVYPPLVDAPPAPRFVRTSYRNGFEKPSSKKGKKYGAFTLSEGRAGAIRIEKKGAAQGNACLRLEKTPNMPLSWQPHLFYDCTFTGGVARVRFSIKGEAGANVLFECRDYRPANGAQYATGPTVRLAGGAVTAAGKKLLDLPAGTWCAVEVALNLSGPEAGSWTCTATPAGGASVTVRIPANPKSLFKDLEWTGFISVGNGPYVWYLDDYEINGK